MDNEKEWGKEGDKKQKERKRTGERKRGKEEGENRNFLRCDSIYKSMNQFMEPRSIGKEGRLIVFFAFSASVRLSLSLSPFCSLSFQLSFSWFSYLLLPFPSPLKNFSKLLVSQSNFPPLTSSFLSLSLLLSSLSPAFLSLPLSHRFHHLSLFGGTFKFYIPSPGKTGGKKKRRER